MYFCCTKQNYSQNISKIQKEGVKNFPNSIKIRMYQIKNQEKYSKFPSKMPIQI
jgi:hypothetical protein